MQHMIELRHKVRLGLKADKIDLAKWLFSMSNNDYVGSSQNHRRYIIIVERPSSKRIILSEESAGGTYVTHHYKEIISTTNHVKVFSDNSKASIFHFIPIPIKVTWELKTIPLSNKDSELQCAIQVSFPNTFLELLARLIFSRYFWNKHCVEETEGFKNDILRKISLSA